MPEVDFTHPAFVLEGRNDVVRVTALFLVSIARYADKQRWPDVQSRPGRPPK